MNTKRDHYVVIAAAMVIGGCSLTPPAEVPPLVSRIDSMEQYHSRVPALEITSTNGWWTDIGGDPLAVLVEELLANSLVLREARQQALQAVERSTQATGQRRPAIGYSIDRVRSRAQEFTGDFAWAENYSAGLNLNFEADVWGRLRATERSALLTAEAAQYSYISNEQLEIARLVRNWVAAVSLSDQLALARDTARIFETTYSLTDERYRAGSQSASASDVLIARQNLEFALIDIPELERQLANQLIVIDEQLARLPGTTAAEFEYQSLPSTITVPALDRPVEVLATRPDVAAAELRYRAALQDVGASRANLYPALSLSAAISLRGESTSDFSLDDYIASLTSALAGPIFQGGRLRSQVRLEQAEARELATAFARTTHSAVIDVETALVSLEGLTRQLDRSRAAVLTARQSNDLVEFRYRQGLSSLLSVLETQRSLNTARQSLILTEQSLANAQIDLFVSLGGDWT